MTLPFVHLRVRTEFSFRDAYGRVDDVLARVLATQSAPFAAITDTGTWGHAAWRAACATHDATPLYGVELPVVPVPDDREKQPAAKMVFLAKNQQGLSALYRLVARANERFYYTARLGYRDVSDVLTTDGNLIVLAGSGTRLDLLPPSAGCYLTLSPTTPEWNVRVMRERMYERVLVADARYPTREDQPVYETHAGQFKQSATVPLHLPTLDELRRLVPQADDEAVINTARIAFEIGANTVTLPTVGTLKFADAMDTVTRLCGRGMVERGLHLRCPDTMPQPYSGMMMPPEYCDRYWRELDIIEQKGFADYFVLVADMVQWAKQRMLVGPGRGSSAGSLVCYLLGITDVDPLPHGLLFERFIDVTRTDWPDIDLDFPDRARSQVFDYLRERYGERHVARLGNIIRYKPDAALNQVCRVLDIPPWEIKPFRERIPPKPDGDTAYDAIEQALASDSLGAQLLDKYPGLIAAATLEGHANTSGTHAGGVVVADRPLDEVCGVGKDRTLMVDKRQAEQIGMLKVDVLGLLTLSVLDDCLSLIGKDRAWLLALPLDDPATYGVFQRERLAGVFQFEGKTQGGLVKQMAVESFADITALGALSRPGPLDAGATKSYLLRRMGKERVPALHPVYDAITAETYGIIAYQEQMMAMLRQVGQFDWPLVSKLRKAINQKMGEDWFDAYRTQFVAGAATVGLSADAAHRVWDTIITFGQYAFNKCVAGDTLVRMAGTNQHTPEYMTIEALYRRYVLCPDPQMRGRMPTLQSLHPDGRVRPQKAKAIVYSGKKLCRAYTFSDGTTIRCTPEHRFLIDGVWRPIGDAAIGATFAASEYAGSAKVVGCDTGRGNIAKGKTYGARQGFPSGATNPSYVNGKTKAQTTFIAAHRGQSCEDCGQVRRRMEAHHLDGAHGEIAPTALVWLCASCHKKREYAAGRTKRWEKGHHVIIRTLVAVEDAGELETYDIEMPEHHNFVIAGGIITHNSHAVAYGLISYWAAYLKAHHPLEFACAVLRNPKDDEAAVKTLRDLVREGYQYVSVDLAHSDVTWTVVDGKLLGGLTTVRGVGEQVAKEILACRRVGHPLREAVTKLFAPAVTPFDDIFEMERRFGAIYADPKAHRIVSELSVIRDVDGPGTFVFLGKITARELKEKDGQPYVKVLVADDTDEVWARVNRREYRKLGRLLAEPPERDVVGKCVVVKGEIYDDFRIINVENYRWLDQKPTLAK